MAVSNTLQSVYVLIGIPIGILAILVIYFPSWAKMHIAYNAVEKVKVPRIAMTTPSPNQTTTTMSARRKRSHTDYVNYYPDHRNATFRYKLTYYFGLSFAAEMCYTKQMIGTNLSDFDYNLVTNKTGLEKLNTTCIYADVSRMWLGRIEQYANYPYYSSSTVYAEKGRSTATFMKNVRILQWACGLTILIAVLYITAQSWFNKWFGIILVSLAALSFGLAVSSLVVFNQATTMNEDHICSERHEELLKLSAGFVECKIKHGVCYYIMIVVAALLLCLVIVGLVLAMLKPCGCEHEYTKIKPVGHMQTYDEPNADSPLPPPTTA